MLSAPFDATLAGERVQLHAERALYFPRGRTLYVADVHLGKSAAFRAGGIPLPRGVTEADLARLARLIAGTRAEHLVVLGDFLHAAAGRTESLNVAFDAWRETHRALALTLVRGNHDARAGDPPPAWRVDVVAEPYTMPPFLLCHEPPADADPGLFGYALSGHVHPGVHVIAGAERERLPCFVLGRGRAILPAFGSFTGLAMNAWSPDERLIAIAATACLRFGVDAYCGNDGGIAIANSTYRGTPPAASNQTFVKTPEVPTAQLWIKRWISGGCLVHAIEIAH
jgi:DNA ligase-associated metallophosphoesterase